VIRAKTANDLIAIPTAEHLGERLEHLLSDVWVDRWLKAPPKKRKSPHHDTPHIPRAHVSIYRLIHGIPAPKNVHAERANDLQRSWFSTCHVSYGSFPINDPSYALLRIFSNACNVAASLQTSPLPIAGQPLASSLSYDFQIS
jgi:hypothetical protein